MLQQEAITIFLNKVKAAYIDDQKAKGIISSGKSAASLKTFVSPRLGLLTGSSYFTQQRLGRRPGRFPPVEAIIEWIKEKGGFNIEGGEKGIKGLAFIIARKISKSGTDIFMKKRPALSVEDKILEYRKELTNNIGNIAKNKIIETIKQKTS